MSSTIWTRCAGRSEIGPLSARPWRMVESQHRVSTLKLVDDLESQALLEELIDEVKPPLPKGLSFRGLHYLLATPFRYPPLRHGSRFGARDQRGLWYGSEESETVMAEVAHYRRLFLRGTEAELGTVTTEHTLFRVPVKTNFGVDLTAPAFEAYSGRLASKTSYQSTQALGRAMREDGVEAFYFRSARDPREGRNIGVFNPTAFARRDPLLSSTQTWRCLAEPERVVFSRIDSLRRELRVFRLDGEPEEQIG